MINPIIFSINIGSFVFALRWYGVLVMMGVSVAAWFANREVTWRGEKGDAVWDLLVWILDTGFHIIQKIHVRGLLITMKKL